MRRIRVRSYLLLILAVFFALSGPISTITFFAQNSSAIDEATLDMFAENNIMFYDPDEQDCTPTQTSTKPTGDQITWIGDSYSVGAESIIKSKLPGVDIHAQGSKHFEMDAADDKGGDSGLTILEQLKKNNQLRPYLVFALGTNDLVSKDTMAGYIKTLLDDDHAGKNTKIVLVTAYTKVSGAYTNGNNAIKEASQAYDNIFVADWAAVAKDEYYASDPESVHPTAGDGYKVWVDTIYDALPGGTTSLVAGTNIAEKVWNWLVNFLNTQNVNSKDISAIVSGIMGNLYTESGLNPLMEGAEDPSYVGIWMLKNEYGGTEYRSKMKAALGSDYVKFYGWWNSDVTYDGKADKDLKNVGLTDEQIDTALNISLQLLTGNSNWSEFIKGVKDWGVSDTAEGYSDLFLVTAERATPGSKQVKDEAVKNHYSGTYQKVDERRESARRFYNDYANSSVINPTAPSTSTTSSSSMGDNKNYAGEEVWSADELAKVEEYKPIYQAAAQQYGLPWQLLATVHRLESTLSLTNPDNGQGVYQLYGYTGGGTNSNRLEPGPISKEEFQRQSNLAAEEIKGKITSGGYDPNSDEGAKYLLFAYNGQAKQYKQKALDMGFSQKEANIGEGSPYVMNRYDARRDPNSSSMDPHWPGRFVKDGVYDPDSVMWDFGGFVIYKALGGGGGSATANECPPSSSSPSGSAGALIELVKQIAWPTWDDKPFSEATQAYKDIANEWKNSGKYVGCSNHGPAEDCGAFVTIALVESGFDPDYNAGGVEAKGASNISGNQLRYVQNSDKWELVNADWNTPINDESELSPGDVAFQNGCDSAGTSCKHTFLYIGEVEGFEYHVASASCNERFPRAGKEAIISSSEYGITRWFHKVK